MRLLPSGGRGRALRCILFAGLLSWPLFAQTGEYQKAAQAPEATAQVTFEVATVKPAAPGQGGHSHINYPQGGDFSAQNVTIAALMQWAWSLQIKQIMGGPEWMRTTAFDLQAKTSAETDTALRAMPQEDGSAAKRILLQALLGDRFGLKLHRETLTQNAYDLVIAKGGPRLEDSKGSGISSGGGRTHLNGQGLTTALIAQQLSPQTDRIVVDRTGLTGRYDFKLQWSPDDAGTDAPFPPLFTAIQDQLGLKLVPAKEDLPALVIDAIHLPSEN